MKKNISKLKETGESTRKRVLLVVEKDLMTGVYFLHNDKLKKKEIIKLLNVVLKELKK